MNRSGIALPAIVVLAFLPVCARAQTASITGTVKDATGAVVPQTRITAQNVGTNAPRTVVTDESGIYRITNLAPGTYDVLIEKSGFNSLEFSQITLAVDHVQNLDATLTVSSVEARVKVTGESVAPLDLNDAQIGNTVTSQQISSLPLVLRDPYQLALLSPGVNQSNSILGGLSVNGSGERNNNFLLDGTDNNDTDIPGLTLPQPGLTTLNPDAVQEFRVIASNLLPEFGRNIGGVVDIITKSGTNAFQEDLYWFGRCDALGARDFFNHELDAAGQVVPKDAYTRNTFGGSAGGPIVRDKTFWFVNYEGQRFDTTLTNHSVVPTAAFKTGTFTYNGQVIDVSLRPPPATSFNFRSTPQCREFSPCIPCRTARRSMMCADSCTFPVLRRPPATMSPRVLTTTSPRGKCSPFSTHSIDLRIQITRTQTSRPAWVALEQNSAGRRPIQSRAIQPAGESYVRSRHVWPVDWRSYAPGWNLGSAASAIRTEVPILKRSAIKKDTVRAKPGR
jgi:Carboxypeptidase regulatory-like domain